MNVKQKPRKPTLKELSELEEVVLEQTDPWYPDDWDGAAECRAEANERVRRTHYIAVLDDFEWRRPGTIFLYKKLMFVVWGGDPFTHRDLFTWVYQVKKGEASKEDWGRLILCKDNTLLSLPKSKEKQMQYQPAFHKACLAKQGLAYTPKNVQQVGVPDWQLSLLYENQKCWVVLNNEGYGGGQWINVIWTNKDNSDIDTTKGMKIVKL